MGRRVLPGDAPALPDRHRGRGAPAVRAAAVARGDGDRRAAARPRRTAARWAGPRSAACAAWRRAASARPAAALLAATAAWFVHAALHSDWDVPGVTVPALLFLGVLCGGVVRRSPAAGVPGAVVFVDPDRPARTGVARTAGVLVATLAACAYVASAVLPSWSDGKSSDAQRALGAPAPVGRGPADRRGGRGRRRAPGSGGGAPAARGSGGGQSARSLARGAQAAAAGRPPAARQRRGMGARWPGRRERSPTAPAPSARRCGRLQLDPQNPALLRLVQEAESALAPPGGSATASGTPLTAPSP